MSAVVRDRLVYLAVSAICAIVLAVASVLSPSPNGHGTHEGLGLPACPLLSLTGWPCPACGMTTAFAHGMQGELLDSMAAQPFGFVVFLMTIVVMVAATVSIVRPVSALWKALGSRTVAVCLALLWVGSWIYKITSLS